MGRGTLSPRWGTSRGSGGRQPGGAGRGTSAAQQVRARGPAVLQARARGAAEVGTERSGPGSRGMRGLCAHPERRGLARGGSAACDGRAGSRGTQSCLLGPCRQHAEGQGKGCAGSTRPRTAWPTILPQSASRKPRTSALHPRSEAPCGHRGCGQGLARMGKSSPALQGVTPVGPSERRPCLFIAGCPLCQTCSPEVRDPATWGTWGGGAEARSPRALPPLLESLTSSPVLWCGAAPAINRNQGGQGLWSGGAGGRSKGPHALAEPCCQRSSRRGRHAERAAAQGPLTSAPRLY